jgi:hypothetical protein
MRTALTAAQVPGGDHTTVLGRYSLVKRLGAGAFGSVWSARDERLDRDVAVKLLPRERVIHARFEREARAAARLQHPAIVTLYEAAVDDEGAYLVSELVRGRTLDAVLEQGKLSDRDIVEIGVALCDALDHAHSQGVIHRDVKPSNVLVPSRASGPADRAKLTDFGVAHIIGGDALTRTGDVIGTLAYMAPEQADGEEAGPEADLYALALVLYEALTGVNPQARTARQRRRIAFVPPVRRLRRDLTRDLAGGIDHALRPRPHERGTLTDLRIALTQSLGIVDDTARVVTPAGWRGHDDDATWVQDQPGPEWRAAPQDEVPRGLGLRRGAPAPTAPFNRPAWLARGANAIGAGLGAAWVCDHVLRAHAMTPAVVVLAGAVGALLLPLTGSLLTAVVLGSVALAGAFPAVAGLVGRRWWQRALFAAAGFMLLITMGKLAHHDLYWLPGHIPPHQPRALLGAAVWAAAAAVAPMLRTRRFPVLDLLLVGLWSAVTLATVQALGATSLRGATLGAVLGGLILAAGPLLAVVEDTRTYMGIDGDVA